MSDSKPLNPKQARFVEHYVSTGNGLVSAKLAGYAAKSAHVTATKLLKVAKVQEAIRERRGQLEGALQQRTEITREMLLDRLAHFAFGDLSDVATWDGDGMHVTPSGDLSKEQVATVKKLMVTEHKRFDKAGTEIGSTVRTIIEQKDQLRAIELIAKLLGYLTEKHEHTGKDGKPIKVQPSYDQKAIQSVVMQLMARAGRKFE